jgi:hypothetical protein
MDLTIKWMAPKSGWTRQATPPQPSPTHSISTFLLHTLTRSQPAQMSDPVVVAMGDEKLKDVEGIEEKPLEIAAEATVFDTIPTSGDTDATPTSPVSPKPIQNVSPPDLLALMTRPILRLFNRNTCPPIQRTNYTAQTHLPPP